MGKVYAMVNQKGGVGKCISPETPIILNPGGVVEIAHFFNSVLENPKTVIWKKGEVYIKPSTKYKVFSLNNELKIVSAPIDWVYRGYTNELYRIRTRTGREVKVSLEHPFLVLKNGGLDWIKAKDLNRGDFVATPRNLMVRGEKNMALLPFLSERIFVKIKKKYKNTIAKSLDEILEKTPGQAYKVLLLLKREGVTKATELYKLGGRVNTWKILNNFLDSGVVRRKRSSQRGFNYLLNEEKLVDYLLMNGFSIRAWEELRIPEDSVESFFYVNRYGHKAKEIRPIFTLDERLAEFVAILAAEGVIDPARIVLQNSSFPIIERVTSFCENYKFPFRIEKIPGQWRVTISSAGTLIKTLCDLFEIPIKGIRKSSKVQMPNLILGSSPNILASYLAGYMDCEAYVSPLRSTIEIISASEANIIGLHYAFLRFGIRSSLRKKLAKATNSPSPKLRPYYYLKITGKENIRKVLKNIPLKDKRKLKNLKKVGNGRLNTNIDLLPVNAIIKKLRMNTNLFQSDLGRQGTISDYENYRSYPSRNMARRIVDLLKSKVQNSQIELLESLSYSDIFWDQIAKIERIRYKGYVYDLTISPDHNFVCGRGAFISHNTTTAVNSAAYLASHRRKTLLIDIDPQGNATSGVGIDKNRVEHSIYEVLIAHRPIERVLLPTQIRNLDLIPSNIQLSGAQIELVNLESRETLLKKALGNIKEKYDYVIVDCPPSLGLLTINTLIASDEVIIPMQCEYYPLEGLGQLLNTIGLVQRNYNPSLKLAGVLLTMFDTRTNLSHQVAREVQEYFGDRVYKTVIPRNVRLAEAPSFGKPILLYDRHCAGAKAYKRLAREIMLKSKE